MLQTRPTPLLRRIRGANGVRKQPPTVFVLACRFGAGGTTTLCRLGGVRPTRCASR